MNRLAAHPQNSVACESQPIYCSKPSMLLRTVCLAFFLLATLARSETITEGGFHLSFTVPKGAENLKAIPPFEKTLLAVGWRDEKKDLIIRGLTISDLGEVAGQGDYSKSIPQKPEYSFVKIKWKQFEIPTVRVEEEARGKPWLTFNAEVPTLPRAVQVQVFGPGADEAALRALLQGVLDSLESKTNWRTRSEWVGGKVWFAARQLW